MNFENNLAPQKKQKLSHSLYGITSQEYSLGRSTITVAEEMVKAGIKIIQYREKEKSKREKYLDCIFVRKITREAGVTFIVNDDVDIALAVGADGVHIGQDDMPLDAVRKLTGEKMIIGVSTHNPGQAQEAVSKGADYIGVGPLYPTKTKKNVCDAVGLSYLDYAVQHVSIPFVAIGGIKLHNLSDVLSHGALCVAMVTEILSAPDIPARVKEISSIIEQWPKRKK